MTLIHSNYIGLSVESKQVLVMRKFSKDRSLRIGKYCSQAAHASLGALISLGKFDEDRMAFTISMENPFVYEWIIGKFTKIVCYVETEDELSAIYNQAKINGIASSIITDSGLTEFNNIPTLTAVGIGPDNIELINRITGHLPLF